MVPSSKIKIETREKPWPLFKLEGAMVQKIEQFGFDRIFSIELLKDNHIEYLVVEAIGPNGNIWLLDDQKNLKGTLRKRDFHAGDKYQFKEIAEKVNPYEITKDAIDILLSENKSAPLSQLLEKKILGFNKTIAHEILNRADLEYMYSDEIKPEQIDELVKAIKNLSEMFNQYDKGYLTEVENRFEAYPFKLSHLKIHPEKYKSLSLAVMAMTEKKQTTALVKDVTKTTLTAVKKTIKKLGNRITKIDIDIKDAENYEQYKKIGELIQININILKKGLSNVELQDIYIEPHKKLKVKLDPALTPAENADRYFKKHRKGRLALELLKRRLEISMAEHKNWQIIFSELENNFENASQKYQPEIASILPKSVNSQAMPVVRLPYKDYKLSTGLTIFVGRDGSDNDRTTFEFAKPYELWFHAQQCPGSHVVMKFPNKSFEPSKLEIEETAAVAAFHSKAKKNSLVPVIYCPRRYVHKPRKAKPGLVTVEREKSLMVEPRKPES